MPVSYVKGTIGNKTDAVLGLTELKAARFGVFGYFTGAKEYRTLPAMTWDVADVWKYDNTEKYPNFFYNQEIYFDDATGKNAWVYEPVKYWPNGNDAANDDTNPNVNNTPSNTAIQKEAGMLSFFAFAPYTAADGDAYVPADDGAVPTGVTAKKTAKTTSGVTAVSDNVSPTDVWVKYLLPNANATEAEDLLWALAGKDAYKETDATNPAKTIGSDYNENLTKQIVPDRVKFLFKHALAKLGGSTSNGDETLAGDPIKCGLKVVADVDYNSTTPKVDGQSKQGTDYFPTDFDRSKTLITLKSVKIQDGKSISDDATITWVTGKTSNLLTFGWFDIETGKWCEQTGTYGVGAAGATYNVQATYDDTNLNNTTYTINDDIREPSSSTAVDNLLETTLKKTWNGDGTADKPLGVNIGTPQPVFANENVPSLLFIPTGDGDVKQTIYVTVDYVVRTADPLLAKGYSEVEQFITNEVILDGQSLDPNKYYTLIMHLGMTSVKFEARVTDWSSNTGDEFNEDGTITEQGDENAEVVWLPSNVVTNSFTATIEKKGTMPANYFSNQADYEKTLTVQLNGADVTGTITVDNTHATWLTYDGGKLKTNAANTGANKTGYITVNVAASGDHPAFSQVINVVQYGDNDFNVTATPGKAAGGKFSPVIDATEKVYLTVSLRGDDITIDGTKCKVEVQTATPDWLEWDGTNKYLKVKTANTGNTEPTQDVKVTYTDDNLGVYTKTITMTQAAANLVITPETYSLAKAAGSLSADPLKVKLNNSTDITDEVTVDIPSADQAWLKYNSTQMKFEAKTTNDTGDVRSSTVAIKYGTLSKDVTVTQAKD